MIRAVGLGLLMLGFWMILSGSLTIEHSLLQRFAVGSCLAVIYIARRMDFIDHEGLPLSLGGRFLGYFPWLMKETFKCNVIVAKIILDSRLPISPRMTIFKSGQSTDLGRFIYANSITLTPGTIVTDINGQELQVHCLTMEDTQSEEDEMDLRVTKVEGDTWR